MKVVPILKIVTVSPAMRLIKNTTPKSGCVHLVLQGFFGAIIVTSFVMILLMTLKGAHENRDEVLPCSSNKCRIICVDINFYKEEEIHVSITASEKAATCTAIALTMIRPIFKDGILQENWLSTVRAQVRELTIVEGNLNDISPRSFMDPAVENMRVLIFDKIKISTWREDTFLGLSNLRELYIKDCKFESINENALQAIDDTLKLLDIKATHFWNPVNVTGTSNLPKLEVVNLSFNRFYNVLNNSTFQSLQACKVLYLSSCKINFLGAGTFDHLDSLEVLYLNDNALVMISPGLFDHLLTSELIRIALHNNRWLCSCTQNDLRSLHTRDVLMIEPSCFYPDAKSGLTFSELEEYCGTNKSFTKPNKIPPNKSNSCRTMSISTISHNSADCYKDNLSYFNNVGKTPPSFYQTCLSNRIRQDIFSKTYDVERFADNSSESDIASTWLRPLYSSHYSQKSMIELAVTGDMGYGILWYESKNKNDVYCLNIIPDMLQVFYTELEEEYTFCLFDIVSGDVYSDKCISHKFVDIGRESHRVLSVFGNFLIYICIAFSCILCGATCVFIMVYRNPTLLRRNKRILLVKHKTIDALILPPEVPVRKDVLGSEDKIKGTKEKEESIFVLPHNELMVQNYERSTSMRSSESNDVSYISALSPTEEQLFEWRSNANVDQEPTLDECGSPFSSMYESLPYYSLREKVYETIK